MKEVNIFRYYEQKENRFTNGLLSILYFSKYQDSNFEKAFIKKFNIPFRNSELGVLRDFPGDADAAILSENACFLIETKIRSGELTKEQIKRRIKELSEGPQINKKLLLITPDDSESNFIKQHLKINENLIIHIGWKKIYDFLESYQKKEYSIFTELIRKYLEEIREEVFEQDIVAVIVKISFGKGKNFEKGSKVNPYTYLQEIKNQEWNDWHTPREYKNLSGTGRKLILYDNLRKNLTIEVEIKEVRKTNEEEGYSWSNKFVMDTLKIYDKPTPLKSIKKIPDKNNKFQNFDKCSTPNWNLTREQYDYLMNLKFN